MKTTLLDDYKRLCAMEKRLHEAIKAAETAVQEGLGTKPLGVLKWIKDGVKDASWRK